MQQLVICTLLCCTVMCCYVVVVVVVVVVDLYGAIKTKLCGGAMLYLQYLLLAV